MSGERLLAVEDVAPRIHAIRGKKVMLDFDLAELYGVATKALNQAVSRNRGRFPEDFMFRLTEDEWNRSQTVTGSQIHRDPRFRPRAFTQEGVAMLSSILRSERAILVNIAIMRAFVQMRDLLGAHHDFEKRLGELERRLENHDVEIEAVFKAIRELVWPRPDRGARIGFGEG